MSKNICRYFWKKIYLDNYWPHFFFKHQVYRHTGLFHIEAEETTSCNLINISLKCLPNTQLYRIANIVAPKSCLLIIILLLYVLGLFSPVLWLELKIILNRKMCLCLPCFMVPTIEKNSELTYSFMLRWIKILTSYLQLVKIIVIRSEKNIFFWSYHNKITWEYFFSSNLY